MFLAAGESRSALTRQKRPDRIGGNLEVILRPTAHDETLSGLAAPAVAISLSVWYLARFIASLLACLQDDLFLYRLSD
jgi:hypothetical protein